MLQIPGFKNYFITEDDHVWSTQKDKIYQTPHLQSEYVGKDGYKRVPLTKDGKTKAYLLHRLVASAYAGRELSKDEEVNHKDHNPLNCNHSNLQILSGKEHVKLHSEERKGIPRTEEVRRKISIAKKGKAPKCTGWNRGKKLSPQSIAKRTESRKRNKLLKTLTA